MSENLTLVQAVRDGLRDEMARDDDVVVMGEDVGKNGGVFRATEGLYDEFGDDRVIDTPLAESGIVGTSIGMAAYGLRPVPEIQFMGFIYPAFDQIEGGVDEAHELNLGDGAEAVGGHADGGTDDARLRQRRVDHAVVAELVVEALGRAEDAAVLAHV